jgi:hypothetical protein
MEKQLNIILVNKTSQQRQTSIVQRRKKLFLFIFTLKSRIPPALQVHKLSDFD